MTATALLSSCATMVADPPTRRMPSGAPRVSEAPSQRPGADASPESRALAARYDRIEVNLRNKGLLRTDIEAADAPFDADMLAANFVRVALFDEFVPLSGELVARETSSRLRRWEDPVRVSLEFGASVPADQRRRDRATVGALAARLATASGHDITFREEGGNMVVFVVDEDERRALGPRLRAEMPGMGDDVVRAITDLPPSLFCLVIAFSTEAEPYVYRQALAVVRAEHPPLLRLSCFHEEITQGLGLANDSPEARPSIFNDDEEFALLTGQDALLLAILYDDRLQPGMNAAEALPIVREIASELQPDTLRADAAPEPPSSAAARFPAAASTSGDS